jgi:hypothetical protein
MELMRCWRSDIRTIEQPRRQPHGASWNTRKPHLEEQFESLPIISRRQLFTMQHLQKTSAETVVHACKIYARIIKSFPTIHCL